MSKVNLLIVWHSRTGAARQMAQAACNGAINAARELDEAQNINVILSEASNITASDLLNAAGYVFCAPENLAALSGEMKEFFDRNYYAVLDKLNGRPYALLISAGSDGTMAAKQAERIATGWRLNLIVPAHIVNMQAQTPEAIWAPKIVSPDNLATCEEIGATMAARLLMGIG